MSISLLEEPRSRVVQFQKNRLGQRIVAMMIVSTATLSLLAAGIQLYFHYQRDLEALLEKLLVVEESFQQGIEAALWTFNFDQIDLMMDGIVAQKDVAYLNLAASNGRSWTRGSDADETLKIRKLDLFYQAYDRPEEHVGTLTIGLSYRGINARLREEFWLIVMANFAKTLLAAIIMLFVFDRLVGRHIRRIAGEMQGQPLPAAATRIRLDRPYFGEPDDLDEIVSVMNARSDRIASSIAALRRQADELSALNGQLAGANREQAEFTYAVSHDLKSPTNTLGMIISELDETEGARMDPSSRALLGDAQATVGRMRQLVDDVLGYARSIEMRPKNERIDLDALLADVTRDLRTEIATAGAEIESSELGSFFGNAAQIRILLQNLLSNALKFTRPGVSPLIRIGFAETKLRGRFRLTVGDNGIGIAPEFHDKIFGLFQRLQTQAHFPGTGLGLSICQRIAVNHGGEIAVDSTPGSGTTFRVTLTERSNGSRDCVSHPDW